METCPGCLGCKGILLVGLKPTEAQQQAAAAGQNDSNSRATVGAVHAGAAAGWGGDVLRFARVWLEGACEHCLLLPWHHGPFLVLLLLQDTPQAVGPATAASLLELLQGGGGGQLLHQLQGELPAKHLWHVQGLRYLYSDALCAATQVSRGKR